MNTPECSIHIQAKRDKITDREKKLNFSGAADRHQILHAGFYHVML